MQMEHASFQKVCDELSHIVDGDQFERFRWQRDEAPKLARLAQMVKAAFEGRDDFDLVEEGATSELKRYVFKVHGKRTIAVAITYEDGQAVFRPESINRSAYSVRAGDPITTDYANVDENWIEDALQQVFARMQHGAAQEAQSNPPQAA